MSDSTFKLKFYTKVFIFWYRGIYKLFISIKLSIMSVSTPNLIVALKKPENLTTFSRICFNIRVLLLFCLILSKNKYRA